MVERELVAVSLLFEVWCGKLIRDCGEERGKGNIQVVHLLFREALLLILCSTSRSFLSPFLENPRPSRPQLILNLFSRKSRILLDKE